MTLDKVFKDSEIITSQRYSGAHKDYTVRVTLRKDGATVAIHFKGKAREMFEGSKVVPIVHNTGSTKRIYFAKENQINASDATRNPGFTLSRSGKTDALHIAIKGKYDAFKDFEGEYETIHLDADCMLYFIERPTRF